MKTLNLTQHVATKEQRDAGVVDFREELQPALRDILIFRVKPTREEIIRRVKQLSELIYIDLTGKNKKWDIITDEEMKEVLKDNGIEQIMIGGALWLMKPLIEEINNFSKPVFAFSTREVVEKEIDGKVVKQSIFKFDGFIDAV